MGAPFRLAKRMMGTSNSQMLLGKIRELADQYATHRETQLLAVADNLRSQLRSGKPPTDTDILIQSFALTTETLRRETGMTYYDVQLLGGITLAKGCIAEMQTGEGKTIVIALPAALHALTGQGVHVATTNHYLATRDHAQLEPVFQRMGIQSCLLPEDSNIQQAQAAYQADVTYGTGYQFGFDYLKDQIAARDQESIGAGTEAILKIVGRSNQTQTRQRGHAYAIIDEIDSVMLDEANTPLLMSGTSQRKPTQRAYMVARDTINELVQDEHFVHQEEKRSVELTLRGQDQVMAVHEQRMQMRLSRPWISYIYNALRARVIFQRDEDYVVRDDKVQIVDPKTGRIHPDRTWRDGLHQAIEAKESLAITPPSETQARITRQRYFCFYEKLCGLTGTAQGSESEFRDTYGLTTTVIHRNKPCLRIHTPTRYFIDCDTKNAAIGQEIARLNQLGRPILVGTRTILSSLQIAKILQQLDLSFELLNGVQDDEEAEIVARAGQCRAITIATNIAGRGTDIPIQPEAKSLGGLHMLASEHHQSVRVDGQLIGRSARQGEPGSCQFFVAADDDLFVTGDPQLARKIVRNADDDGECRLDLSHEVLRLQRKLEAKAYLARQQMHRQDAYRERILDTALSRE